VHDRREIERQARITPDEGDRGRRDHLLQQVREARRDERGPPRQDRIQRGTKPVHVGPPIEGAALAGGLLRRHVRRGPDDRRGGRQPLSGDVARDPEIGDEGPPRPVLAPLHQDVPRLDVAVNDSEPVRLVERERDLPDDPRLLLDGHRRVDLPERLPGDVPHDDEGHVIGDAGLEDLADARVEDARLGPGLLQEAALRARGPALQELHRHGAPEAGVARPVHGAHPAAPEEHEVLESLVQGGWHSVARRVPARLLSGAGPAVSVPSSSPATVVATARWDHRPPRTTTSSAGPGDNCGCRGGLASAASRHAPEGEAGRHEAKSPRRGAVKEERQSPPHDATLPAETPAAALSVPSFRLHVVSGPDAGQALCSTSERVVVGTHPSCDLRLSDRLVSRFHCELSVVDGQLVLRDLGSRNGTRLDDVHVREAFPRWRGASRSGRACSA
jgi:hypothetical protein